MATQKDSVKKRIKELDIQYHKLQKIIEKQEEDGNYADEYYKSLDKVETELEELRNQLDTMED